MIEGIDTAVLYFFAGNQNDMWTPFMRVMTELGDAGLVWIVLSLILFFLPKTRRLGMAMALALILCLLVGNGLLKNIFSRPRPCWRHQDIKLLIPNPTDYSFPSGHTFASFASATTAFLWKKRWGFLCLPFALVISVSRLYFCVHYITDILAGMILGICLGVLAYRLVHFFYDNREGKAEVVQ